MGRIRTKKRMNRKTVIDRFGKANIYRVPYCGLQFMLRDEKPFGYTTREEGWACDYYDLGGICVSTGYAPIGKPVPYEICLEFDREAQKIWHEEWEYEKASKRINNLIADFIGTIKGIN